MAARPQPRSSSASAAPGVSFSPGGVVAVDPDRAGRPIPIDHEIRLNTDTRDGRVRARRQARPARGEGVDPEPLEIVSAGAAERVRHLRGVRRHLAGADACLAEADEHVADREAIEERVVGLVERPEEAVVAGGFAASGGVRLRRVGAVRAEVANLEGRSADLRRAGQARRAARGRRRRPPMPRRSGSRGGRSCSGAARRRSRTPRPGTPADPRRSAAASDAIAGRPSGVATRRTLRLSSTNGITRAVRPGERDLVAVLNAPAHNPSASPNGRS